MRNLVFAILLFSSISCTSNATPEETEQPAPKSYLFTYQKDGKTVTDTIQIKDQNTTTELQRMISDPNYKPTPFQSDTVFNSDGSPTLITLGNQLYGAVIKKFEYNNEGKLLTIKGYDQESNIKPFYNDIAIQTNIYDKNWNLTESRFLDEDGNLIAGEIEDTPIIRIKYNDKNQLIEIRFLNDEEHLRATFATVKYKYNKDGEQIIIGWYNAKGEKEN